MVQGIYLETTRSLRVVNYQVEGIIVFLNGERGVHVVEMLTKNSFHIQAVVGTDKLNGSYREKIAQLGLSFLELEKVNQQMSREILVQNNPRLFIVAGFSQIFKSDLLQIPKLGTINLHAGKLPQYRGGSPLNWQLINGEVVAGVSVVKMDKGIDSGEVLAEATFPIDVNDTIEQLHQKANKIFPQLVIEVLLNFDAGKTSGRIQKEEDACYWHQRKDVDGKVNFSEMTAKQVLNMIRGLTKPYPGAWTNYKDKKVRLYKAKMPIFTVRGTPGRICYIQGQGPIIICSDQGILIENYMCPSDSYLVLEQGTFI